MIKSGAGEKSLLRFGSLKWILHQQSDIIQQLSGICQFERSNKASCSYL